MSNDISGITTIEDVMTREILDSRGNPTVQVEVLLQKD
jgi:enolase